MDDSAEYIEFLSDTDGDLDGRLALIRFSTGDIQLSVEEWNPGEPVSESEVVDAVFFLDRKMQRRLVEFIGKDGV